MRYLLLTLGLALTATPALLTSGCAGGEARRTTGEYIDDKGLTARVKSALFADPDVSGLQVDVDTYGGVVQLNGFVDTPGQKTRAEEIARGVEGVRQVQNNLGIREPRAPGG